MPRTVTAIPGAEFITRFNRLEAKIDAASSLLVQVLSNLNLLNAKESAMQAEIEALAAEVARNTSLESAAATALAGLAAKIDAALANATTPADIAKVRELTAQLGNSADVLAAAIVANTRADPAIPVEPAPAPVEPAPAPVEPAPADPIPVESAPAS